MAAYAAHNTNYSTHLLTASKTKTKQEPQKRAYLSGKRRFSEKQVRRQKERKRCQDNGPKAEKDKPERATGLGRRTREEV